jgi:hypothetical protein
VALVQCGVEDVEAEVHPAEEVPEEAQDVVHRVVEALVQDEAAPGEALVVDEELQEGEAPLALVVVVSAVAAEAKSNVLLRSVWR